ncbi:MAG: hypothetical protein KGJ06_06755 [Pseudomonadota bacterium]|nr:hypothetical protein [Pseudomonadota bacterium]
MEASLAVRQPSAVRPFNTWDAAKLLALALMFIDHAGYFFFSDDLWLRAIGRGAAPIFLFLAGFAASYRFKWDIFLLGAVMSASDVLLTGHLRTQNILITILICRAIFRWLEKRGRKIERPYEWYICALALTITIAFVQYGSYGFLFALCGYLQRPDHGYPQALQRHFRFLTFITYGVIQAACFEFSWFSTLVMTAVLGGVHALLSHMEIRPVDTSRWPAGLAQAAKLASYYTGYLYAFHLIALEWMTGLPF